jgi:hypothetical protein
VKIWLKEHRKMADNELLYTFLSGADQIGSKELPDVGVSLTLEVDIDMHNNSSRKIIRIKVRQFQ